MDNLQERQSIQRAYGMIGNQDDSPLPGNIGQACVIHGVLKIKIVQGVADKLNAS